VSDDDRRERIIGKIVWVIVLLPIGIGWAVLKQGGCREETPPRMPTPLEAARESCDRGDASACDLAGSFARSCDLGWAEGCDHAGRNAEDGHAFAYAAQRYESACNAGADAGCADLDALYMSGKTEPPDAAVADAYHERRCAQHDAHACALAGARLEASKDDVRALPLLEEACRARDPLGCDGLGRAYAEGRVVKKDAALAVSSFRTACDVAQSYCVSLARAYDSGNGVPRDHPKALALYTQACNAGSDAACAAIRAP
jgi:TPR repeat protein